MADAPAFGVETIHLDLPALAGAFGRRLHDAGVPTTPTRAADLARALVLVRPVSRRRLYWTARAVLVSDQAQVRAFDRVRPFIAPVQIAEEADLRWSGGLGDWPGSDVQAFLLYRSVTRSEDSRGAGARALPDP